MNSQLKSPLEAAGCSCWIDIGQMGGSQELHSKVDKGIQGAKIILCCMNNDYANLDIWIGRINLAVSTGEPFIPLQTEKQTWLSEEALVPLMSEYLFIRCFYQKATNDPNFWLDDRFTELLE